MAKRRDTKINIGTKAEQEAQSSQSLYGELFATVDRFTLHMFDVAGVPKPVVPSISEVPTAAAVDGATDYVLIYDDSAGIEKKALLDDIVSATVLGTDLSLTSKGASTYVVASSTGTNVTLTASTTSLAGLMTASQFNKLDGIETGATADQTAGEIEAIVNHDSLVGFVANEHIDWTSTTSSISTTGNITSGGWVTQNAVSGSATDLSSHLALYSTTFGMNITANAINVVCSGVNTLTYNGGANIISRVNHAFLGGVDVTGNITVTGTVDGRDIAADGITLDGLASSEPTENIILTATKTSGQNINGIEGTEADLTWDVVTQDTGELTSFTTGDSQVVFTNAGWVNIHASAYIDNSLMVARTTIAVSLYHYASGGSLKYSYHGDMQYNRDAAAAYDTSGGAVNQNMMYVAAGDYIYIRTRIFDDGTSGTSQTLSTTYSKLRIAQIVF